MNNEQTYLWAAHASLEQIVGNLQVLAEEAERIERQIGDAVLIHEMPEDVKDTVEGFSSRLAQIRAEIGEIHGQGVEKTASFHETLMHQEKP